MRDRSEGTRLIDRRKHPRLSGGFHARWEGKSGSGPCLVGDLSLGGCFAYCVDAPLDGEAVTVTIQVDGRPLEPTLEGRVMDVTSDPTARSEFDRGFSMAFVESTVSQEDALRALLSTLRQLRRTA